MGKALYRKYRPKKLSEIVGQDHIATALQNAIKNDRVSHAYLFTGPRGVGKTSVARILAHEVNNLPYEDDATRMDIIEIDAASNRKIDEIRELRERVHIAPTSGKYKVYIIDEVHMLTREAFNALLKTLEEPPAHVIFILATTEAHKLPETITSRTQHFNFKPIDPIDAVPHLRSIAASENFEVTDEALQLIARHSQGSFRDSIGLLDQVASGNKKATVDDVVRTLGIAPDEAIEGLKKVLVSGSAKDAIAILEQLKEQGYHAGQLAKQLAGSLRADILAGQVPLEPTVLTQTLEKLLTITGSHEPNTALELAILGVVLGRAYAEPLAPSDIPKVPTTSKIVEKETPTAQPKQSTTILEAKVSEPSDIWPTALDAMKSKHNTLYGVARMAKPELSGNELVLTFGFPFHQKRLNEDKNRLLIENIILEISGKVIKIRCEVDKTQKAVPAIEKPELKHTPSGSLGTISNIFGGAEVLE